MLSVYKEVVGDDCVCVCGAAWFTLPFSTGLTDKTRVSSLSLSLSLHTLTYFSTCLPACLPVSHFFHIKCGDRDECLSAVASIK